MVSKCIVVAFVALFAIQGIANAKSLTDPKSDLGDKILEIIQNIQKKIDGIVDDAIAKLPALKENIENAADKIMKDITAKTQEAVDKSFEIIDKLKQQAAENGINVDLCLGHQEQEIHDVADNIVADTSACVQDNVKDVDDIFEIMLEEIQEQRNQVKELEDEFAQCKDAACVLRVFLKAQKLLISLPIKVTELVIKSQAKIVNIQVNIAVCLTKNSKKIVTDLVPIAEGIAKCIKDKITGNKIEPRANGERINLDNILDIIDKINASISKVIQDGIKKLGDLVETIKTVAGDIIEDVNKKVKEIIDNAFNTINKLQDDAAKLGIDVTDCIGEQETVIKNIADESIENTKKCVTSNLSQVDEIVANAKAGVQEVLDEVKALRNKASTCIEDKTCLQVFLEAQKLLISLPIKVGKLFLESQAKVIKIQADIGLCLVKNTADLNNKVAPIIKEVTTCIKNTINEH